MKIAVDQITESPQELRFSERTEELNLIYKEDQVKDFHFPPLLDVGMVYYRSGLDLFFQGSLGGTLEGHCGRCLKSFSLPIKKKFAFVLTPELFSARHKELTRDDVGLSFYTDEEVNLSPLIREQVLLAVPLRPLCDDGCRGLCGGCGVNLNDEGCRCVSSFGDPRMTFFRTLKLGQ